MAFVQAVINKSSSLSLSGSEKDGFTKQNLLEVF